MTMRTSALGKQGLITTRIGLGCMGMSEFYGVTDDTTSIKVIHRALDLGVRFFDTSDMYGPYTNEMLLGNALGEKRKHVTLATKFGIVRDPANPGVRAYNGKPAYVKSSCEGSLKRLRTDVIDLYYLHRVDQSTPIEETVGAMGELVKEGKVRAIGLSEASSATIRRAHATFPISALQTEYSLWSRDPEDDLLDTCRELGISFVAYSPLGRGFLTGQIRKFEDFEPGDFRRHNPRFQGENFQRNLELVRRLETFAAQKGCTPSQLALAWVLAQGHNIFAIPGTKKLKYLEENTAADSVQLTAAELKELDLLAPKGFAAGTRYPEAVMKFVNV